ncbi:hypothetical protein [Streptomyces sp. CA-111067]|uniref:hypothetical protein n=1 Tax=Streptomyces sp. CA-111067 TaxID=3240046 RepID=UPI003D993F10
MSDAASAVFRESEPGRGAARAVGRVEAALAASAAPGGDGLEQDERLVEAVRGAEAAGAGESAAVLRLLADQPRGLLRLDEAVRRTWGYHLPRRGQPRREAGPGGSDGPLGVALASAHPDGRVRERTVRRLVELLGDGQLPADLLPFLILRTADWVRPVRDRARAALAVLLDAEPQRFVPAALPVTLLLARRERGGFAERQVRTALLSAPRTDLVQQLLAAPDPLVRRFVLRAALDSRRLPLAALVAITKRDGDRRCRGMAAEAAVREAVWTARTDLLRQLAGSRDPDVRVVALTGLVRTGLGAEVTSYLDDTSPLVRAVARDAVRRAGGDAPGWYRSALAAAGTPAPGAMAGLGETGRAGDAVLLTPLLGHPESAVRAAALRALRVLDAVPVRATVPLLRDPSTKVIREATAALRTVVGQLPDGLARSLLADRDRAAVRRAGFRLLNEPDPAERLRITLAIAEGDPDPRLAKRAADAAARQIRAERLRR